MLREVEHELRHFNRVVEVVVLVVPVRVADGEEEVVECFGVDLEPVEEVELLEHDKPVEQQLLP